MTPRQQADKAINYVGPGSSDGVLRLVDAYRALGYTFSEHLDFWESKPPQKKLKQAKDPSERGIAMGGKR